MIRMVSHKSIAVLHPQSHGWNWTPWWEHYCSRVRLCGVVDEDKARIDLIEKEWNCKVVKTSVDIDRNPYCYIDLPDEIAVMFLLRFPNSSV